MKFELTPYNYGLSDDELLGDLRKVATHLGRDRITKDEYNKHGRLCAATFQKRFGSWGKALDIAGLKRTRYDLIGPPDYLADVRRVATDLKSDSVTREDYEKHGQFSYASVVRHLGPWKAILDQAGLLRSSNFNPPISDEQLFENLEQLWEKLGRQPTRDDFVKPVSRYSYTPYPRRFGSYRKALEAFVEAVTSEERTANAPENAPPQSEGRESDQHFVHRTNRKPSWRLRFLVMRRDNFRCVLCGSVQNPDGGVTLELDHIVPWCKEGETTMANLQTLCNRCNGGKSNLSIDENR